MTRALVAPTAVLAAVTALAAGFVVAGPTTAALSQAAILAAPIAVAAALGWGAGRLAARDPRESWALSPTNAKILLGILLGLGAIAHIPAGAAAACPLAAGYLRAGGSRHASDVAFAGAVLLTAGGVLFHPSDWDASTAWILPCIMVALALLARETWDLADARADARAASTPLQGAARQQREPAAERRELARAVLVLGAAVALAGLLGAARPSLRGLSQVAGPGLATLVLVACLWGVLRLVRPQKA